MTIQEIKKEFFAYRNGIIADTLRRSGYPHKVIFGLNFPQIKDIATRIGTDHQLGLSLWQDAEVRESRLLACRLLDASCVDDATFDAMLAECRTPEERDMLRFALHRRE